MGKLSLIVPLVYVALLFGPLYIFSKYYMGKKKYRKGASSWFPTHHTRDLYISLLSHDPQPPNHVLAAALIRRSMTDVQRVQSIKESKQALNTLLQKGLIGDDFFAQFNEAEKELEAELLEVVQEAETFRQGWGKWIFPHANEMLQHEKVKQVVDAVDSQHRQVAGPSAKAIEANQIAVPPLFVAANPVMPQQPQGPVVVQTPTGPQIKLPPGMSPNDPRVAQLKAFLMAQAEAQRKNAAAGSAPVPTPSPALAKSKGKQPMTNGSATLTAAVAANKEAKSAETSDAGDAASDEGENVNPAEKAETKRTTTTPNKSKPKKKGKKKR